MKTKNDIIKRINFKLEQVCILTNSKKIQKIVEEIMLYDLPALMRIINGKNNS